MLRNNKGQRRPEIGLTSGIQGSGPVDPTLSEQEHRGLEKPTPCFPYEAGKKRIKTGYHSPCHCELTRYSQEIGKQTMEDVNKTQSLGFSRLSLHFVKALLQCKHEFEVSTQLNLTPSL